MPKEKELGSSGVGTLFNVVWEERTNERETIDKKGVNMIQSQLEAESNIVFYKTSVYKIRYEVKNHKL